MNALAPIADRLSKLLRLLTSDQDGEVVGAARAIVRTLDNAGLDIHQLAEVIEKTNGAGKAEMKLIYDAGFADGLKQAIKQGGFQSVDEPSWHEIATECAAHPDKLFPQETDFVADMARRTVHGGRLSEKQAAWLRKIYARVRR